MGASTKTAQSTLLATEAAKVCTEAATEGGDVRSFKSGNTGLYLTRVIKGQAARELGIEVPPGGKVKVQVTVIVVDPENSDS